MLSNEGKEMDIEEEKQMEVKEVDDEILNCIIYSSSESDEEQDGSSTSEEKGEEKKEADETKLDETVNIATNAKLISRMSLSKRRETLQRKCNYETKRILGRELDAKKKGFASFAALQRSERAQSRREAALRKRQTWNKGHDYGSRGHDAYKDGRKLYQELTGRACFQIGGFFQEKLRHNRRPLTPDEETLYKHISQRKRAEQISVRNSALNSIEYQIKKERDIWLSWRDMIIEDFRSKANEEIKSGEKEDIPHICSEIRTNCDIAIQEIKELCLPSIELLNKKRNDLIERFDKELEFRIKRELERQRGRKAYSETCNLLQISQCIQLMDQIGRQTIRLDNYGLIGKQVEALVQAIACTKATKALILPDNLLNNYGCFALSYLLRTSTSTLVEINLVRNRINTEGADALFNALQKDGSSCLEILNLRHNEVGHGSGPKIKEMCSKIQRCIQRKRGIREIYLGYNKCGPIFGKMLGIGLNREDCSLTKLDLEYNNLTTNGCTQLLQGLQLNRSLKWLNISTNGCTDSVAASLGYILEDIKCVLECIKISNSRIESKGAIQIAKSLEENMSLQELDLSGCSIGDSGTLALVQSLAVNTRLERLKIDALNEYKEKQKKQKARLFEYETRIEVISFESYISLIGIFDAKGSAYGISKLPSLPPGMSEERYLTRLMQASKAVTEAECVPGLCCLAQITKSKNSPWLNVRVERMVDEVEEDKKNDNDQNDETSGPKCEVLLIDYDDTKTVEIENLRIVPTDIAVASLTGTNTDDSDIVFLPSSISWLLGKEESFYMTHYPYSDSGHPDKGNVLQLLEILEETEESVWLLNKPSNFNETEITLRLPNKLLQNETLSANSQIVVQFNSESQNTTVHFRKMAQQFYGVPKKLLSKLRVP